MRQIIPWALTALGAAMILPGAAKAQTVYTTDFSSAVGAEWSDNTRATANGETFLGTSANGFGNGTDTLSLSSLPAHSSVTIAFDLYIIQSWDGNGQQGGGEDAWQLGLGGSPVFKTNFANFTGANTQAFPNQVAPFGVGGNFAPRTGAFDNGHLGFGLGDFGDSTYRFSLTFPQSASSLAINFTSLQNQAPGDEGWGLDNVTISVSGGVVAAPEPGALALLAFVGLTALVGRRFRK